MSPPVLIDASVPIYAAGGDSAYNPPCARVLTLAASQPESFVTDAGVLQEIFHRYFAAGQPGLGSRVVSSFAQVMEGHIEPVTASDVVAAASMAEGLPEVSARVLLHLAVARRLGIDRVISVDAGFDRVTELTRLDPMRVAEWESLVSE